MKSLFTQYACCGLICLVFALLGSVPNSAQAYSNNDSAEVMHNRESGKSAAASKAQAQYGGKVLSVSEEGSNDQKIYKVKLLLDSGRIKIVTIRGE